jgi:hypothetical protein
VRGNEGGRGNERGGERRGDDFKENELLFTTIPDGTKVTKYQDSNDGCTVVNI